MIVHINSGSVWTAAIIPVGSAILGALVGGFLAFRIAVGQARLERRAAKRDRSHAAALTIAEALFTLSRGVDAGLNATSPPMIAAAVNDFNNTIGAPLIALADEEVKERVKSHRAFSRQLGAGSLRQPSTMPDPDLVEAFKRHQEATYEVLEAHVAEKPLPAYRRPPLKQPDALAQWTNQD